MRLGTRVMAFLVMTAAALAVVMFALFERPSAIASAGAVGSSASSPRHIYLRDCAQCHGADGGGSQYGPDLHHAGAALVDFELSSGRMPVPYAAGQAKPTRNEQQPRRTPRYDAATISALVDYVTRLTGGQGAPIPEIDARSGNLASGGSLFRAQCAACHAWSGNGGALLHRDAPSTHPATALQIAEAVRGGPGNMPRFGSAALTDRQLDSLVRYVRYLDEPDDRGGNPLWHLGPFAEGAVAIVLALGAVVVATRWIGTRT